MTCPECLNPFRSNCYSPGSKAYNSNPFKSLPSILHTLKTRLNAQVHKTPNHSFHSYAYTWITRIGEHLADSQVERICFINALNQKSVLKMIEMCFSVWWKSQFNRSDNSTEANCNPDSRVEQHIHTQRRQHAHRSSIAFSECIDLEQSIHDMSQSVVSYRGISQMPVWVGQMINATVWSWNQGNKIHDLRVVSYDEAIRAECTIPTAMKIQSISLHS